MKKLILLALITSAITAIAFNSTTKNNAVNTNKITNRIHPSVIHYYNYSDLSEWNQLRYNLAKSIKNVHGTTKLYDNYAKVLHCESAGWKNSRNPKSSASGLFQCMRGTFNYMKERSLAENPNLYEKLFKNVTFDDFRKKPLKIQALYFEPYLRLYDKKVKLIRDDQDQATRQIYAYLMVLKPSAVGRSWKDPVFIKGQSDYDPNKGIPHVGTTIKLVDVYRFCMNKYNR